MSIIGKSIKSLTERRISIHKFVYYNYFCKNIVRDKNCKVVPYAGSIVDLAPSSKIYLKGKNLVIGHNKLKGSKSETHIRMDADSVWHCNNGALLFYDTVLELKEKAVLNTGFFSANGGSVIIVDKNIALGEDVMIGRNVIIYDSDFHAICDSNNVPINPPKPVVIEDHVWLTSNITVLKGVTIGKDSLITAQTVITKDVPAHCVVAGKGAGNVIKGMVNWNRDRCPVE